MQNQFWGLTARLFVGLSGVGQVMAGECQFVWETAGAPVFGGSIRSMVVYDDGTGPAIYAAGEFIELGGSKLNSIARYNEQEKRWESLDQGLTNQGWAPGNITALATYRAPGAPNDVLVAVGTFDSTDNFGVFVNNVAQWDGTSWSAMGEGFAPGFSNYSGVHALTVYNGELYAAGDFTIIGGFSTRGGFAKWNPSGYWELVGEGMSTGATLSMTVFDGGLVLSSDADGRYGIANIPGSAKWNGTSWSPIGNGLPQGADKLISFDPDGPAGNPPMLVALNGGNLRTLTNNVWNAPISVDVSSPIGLFVAAVVYNDGSGDKLYLGGNSVSHPTDPSFTRLARFDGTTVQTIGPEIPALGEPGLQSAYIQFMGVLPFEGQDRLFVGGLFDGFNLLTWNGTDLVNPFTPNPAGFVPSPLWGVPNVSKLVAYDPDGAGSQQASLYAFGSVGIAGEDEAIRIAKWNGSSWQAGEAGINAAAPRINSATTVQTASGHELWAVAPVESGPRVYKLQGSIWTPIGNNTAAQQIVTAKLGGSVDQVFTLGSNSGNYAFNRWNTTTSSWDSLTVDGMSANGEVLHAVSAGNNLFLIYRATYGSAPLFARWDGSTWTSIPLPGGAQGMNTFVHNNTVFASVNGYDGYPPRGIHRWNGTTWDPKIDFPPAVSNVIYLGPVDMGQGSLALFAISPIWTYETLQLYTFDGSTWAQFDAPPVYGTPNTAVRFDTGGQTSLWVGGLVRGVNSTVSPDYYDIATGNSSYGTARYYCPEVVTPTCPADFNGDNTRDVADLFAYINSWLAKTPNADFNNDSTVDVADLFAYINAWLAGC